MKAFFSFLSIFVVFSLSGDIQLRMDPEIAYLSEPLAFLITGLKENEEVALVASLKDEKGRRWHSQARFRADRNGVVDLSKQAPLQGTYSGIDPMGLFWSMELDAKEADRNFFEHTSLNPLITELRIRSITGEETRFFIQRNIAVKGVQKIPLSDDLGLDGNLFLPEGPGPFPALLVVGGSNCGIPYDPYAALFSNQGYAVLSLAYCQTKHTSPYLEDIPLEIFQKGVDWLKKDSRVDATHLFMIGTSMGAVATLAAASQFQDIKGVIAFVGRGFVPQAVDIPDSEAKPVFTLSGKPLPFLPAQVVLNKQTYQSGFFLQAAIASLLKMDRQTVDKLAIPVENIQGPILLMTSLDDQIAASAISCEVSYDRLVNNRFSHPYEFIVYKGAGHLMGEIGLPYCPTTVTTGRYHQEFKSYYNFGGNPADTAFAQADSWKRAFEFLRKHLQKSNANVIVDPIQNFTSDRL